VRRRAAVLLLAAVAAVFLAGCGSGHSDDAAARSTGAPDRSPAGTPALGGPTPRWHQVPQRAMDRLEKPVAGRLARQIAPQGLTLAYLDCPGWGGALPRDLTCRGYVDGLVVDVRVLVKAAGEGRALSFDARLGTGVIATHNLVDILHTHGWPDVDCGDVAAYPARVGSRIVCLLRRGSHHKYVVATVRSRSGAVLIADYPGSKAAG
jgi:hypothetical protein